MRNLPKLLIALCALICPALAFGQSGVRFDGLTLSPSGRPVSASVAVCNSPGLLTTGAQVIGNTAILTFATSPITAGFSANMQIAVSGFSGGDTYFNVGTLQPFASTVTITAVSATTITFPLTHANASASSNGNVLQMGNISTPCAPLASIFSDAAVSVPVTQPGFVSSNIGNFGFYVAPGSYAIQYYGTGITTYLQPLTLTMVFSNASNALTGNPLTITDLNGGKYVDGTKYATANAALAACPGTGCTIDMRGNPTALALGNFDPGATTPVTLLLGPYAYTATQITLRTGFNLIGSGSGYTLLTQTTAGTHLFVLSSAATPTQHVVVTGLNIQGAPASTTDAFHIFASSAGAGLWYSAFQDIVCGAVTTFGGNCFQFNGQTGATGNLNQWITMRDIRCFRATSGPPDLLITGLNGQFTIDGGSQFDGATARSNADNGINIQIDDTGETFGRAPYSIHFFNTTSQNAWGATGVAVRTKGVQDVTFINGHFENDTAVIKESIGATYGSWGVSIINSSIDTATGINGGNGYMANLDASSSLLWMNNTVAATPDAFFTGTTTFLTHIVSIKNNSATLQPQDTQFPNTLVAKRLGAVNGTNLTAGAVSFSANWGNTGNPVVATIAGTDAAFALTVTSGGAGQGANPTITVVFADGTWTNPPVCIPTRTDLSAPAGGYWAYNLPGSATQAVFSFVGTPAAATGYGMSVTCFKKQN